MNDVKSNPFDDFLTMLCKFAKGICAKDGDCGPTRVLCGARDPVAHGEHKHRCKCGAIWKHGDLEVASLNDFTEGHTCPSCGAEVREKYYGEAVG